MTARRPRCPRRFSSVVKPSAALSILSAIAIAASATAAAATTPKQDQRDRVEQCNRLIGVLNTRTALDNAFANGEAPSAQRLSNLAARSTNLAGSIGTIPLRDRTLLEYRNDFARLYRTLGSSMSVLANAMTRIESIPRTPAGREEAQRILDQVSQAEQTFDAIPVREERLVNGLNRYCGSL